MTSPEGGSDKVGRRLRIALAGSGGGHVRQLLDLQSVWSEHDYFFVTEDTALGRTLGDIHRAHFLPHFAWGQAKLGAPFTMLSRAWTSFIRSLSIVARERPDIVISTGAGAVFFIVLWARLFGAKVIVVESFARIDKPSLFGRIAAPFAHHMVIQSPKLAYAYPKAKVFDPLVMLDQPSPPKQELIFATVGATLPFPRLMDMAEAVKRSGAMPERLIAQTGVSGRAPEGAEAHETLPFHQVQAILKDARTVICHGGTGSLITALRQSCHVIAVPRLFSLGEHYDDHQAEITQAFARRGLVVIANTSEELAEALRESRTRQPVSATTDPVALTAFLRDIIAAAPQRNANIRTA